MPREVYHQQLRELHADVLALGSMVDKALARSVESLTQRHVMTARQVLEDDDILDDKRKEIERKAHLLIATQQPVADELRAITAAMTVASELERMGDYAEGIAKVAIDLANQPPLQPLATISRMSDEARDMLNRSLDAYTGLDVRAATKIWGEDDVIDDQYDRVYHELHAYMIDDPTTVQAATRLLWVAHNLERVADRVLNICEATAFVAHGNAAEVKVGAASV